LLEASDLIEIILRGSFDNENDSNQHSTKLPFKQFTNLSEKNFDLNVISGRSSGKD